MRKTLVLQPLFNKAAHLKSCNFMKNDSSTGVFKKIYFVEHLQTPVFKSITSKESA